MGRLTGISDDYSSWKEEESIQIRLLSLILFIERLTVSFSMNTESKNKMASGAKRRKESAIKKKKVEQFLTKVPKLSVFCRPISAISQNSSENEIAAANVSGERSFNV